MIAETVIEKVEINVVRASAANRIRPKRFIASRLLELARTIYDLAFCIRLLAPDPLYF